MACLLPVLDRFESGPRPQQGSGYCRTHAACNRRAGACRPAHHEDHPAGGVPITKPADWYKHTNCGYEAPDDPFIVKILEQNIKGEQCAIKSYNSLLKKTPDTDPVTYNIVLGILQMEVEHEEDLQALLEDVNVIMN